MSSLPACPQCGMDNTYPDGDNFVCADCGHEWPQVAAASADDNDERIVKDSNGNLVTTNDEYLWTTSVLQIGYFVTFDDTTYRIIPSNEWTFEGSFTKYTINRVVGDNGTPNTGNFTLGIGGTPV